VGVGRVGVVGHRWRFARAPTARAAAGLRAEADVPRRRDVARLHRTRIRRGAVARHAVGHALLVIDAGDLDVLARETRGAAHRGAVLPACPVTVGIGDALVHADQRALAVLLARRAQLRRGRHAHARDLTLDLNAGDAEAAVAGRTIRSEEHTSELQSRDKLVCRLL